MAGPGKPDPKDMLDYVLCCLFVIAGVLAGAWIDVSAVLLAATVAAVLLAVHFVFARTCLRRRSLDGYDLAQIQLDQAHQAWREASAALLNAEHNSAGIREDTKQRIDGVDKRVVDAFWALAQQPDTAKLKALTAAVTMEAGWAGCRAAELTQIEPASSVEEELALSSEFAADLV